MLLFGIVFGNTPNADCQNAGLAGVNNTQQFMQDVHGRPVYLMTEYNTQGSPFYPEKYVKANLYLKGGSVYHDIPVKFNLQQNLVLYQLADGTENAAITPIQKIIFTDAGADGDMLNKTFKNGFKSLDTLNQETYYEVLDSGKISLLKYHGLKITDQKFYGQASITRVFDFMNVLYLSLPNRKMVKAEKETLLSGIEEKKNELEQYIQKENIKLRKESDWKKLINHYNNLFAS